MTTDKWLSRLFGITVCALAVMVTMTACWLFLQHTAVPDPLDRLVTFLLGALVGRITSSRSAEAGDAPMPTTVVNQPTDPVPVDAGHADLLLLLIIITGVFVGGFLLHLALT